MEIPFKAPPEREEFDLKTGPPLWWDHRDREPARPISYVIVTIDGRRAGRIDRPEVMDLDLEILHQRFPALYDYGRHDVKLDFRAARGRGALGIITLALGDVLAAEGGPGAPQPPPEPQQPSTPAGALVEWAGRVMLQNERLQKMLLEATQSHAANSMDSHERLIGMMASSMERDRTRQTDWLEREAQLRAAVYERAQSGSADAADQQTRMLEVLAPMLASQGGGGGAMMGQIQDALLEKLTGTIMEKIETMGGDGAPDPMSQLLKAAGPLLAAKFAPPDETPPTGNE